MLSEVEAREFLDLVERRSDRSALSVSHDQDQLVLKVLRTRFTFPTRDGATTLPATPDDE